MITLFQITGSSSFAARAALECAGADYEVVNVHPRRRDEAPGFADANPLMRVPAIREGDVRLSECGAILLWVADRFPDAHLAPPRSDAPAFAEHLRWTVWCANTFHVAWLPLMVPAYVTPEESAWPGVRAKAVDSMDRIGAHLEARLTGRDWLAGDAPGVSDIYAYMLVGWANYDEVTVGGPAVAAHYDRVGALPGVARARELDDLDERLIRYHPELRGGQPL